MFPTTMIQNYDFDLTATPRHEWIGMTETHRLPGEPGKTTVWRWTTVGIRINERERLRLPTFQNGCNRRYTTLSLYTQWVKRLAELSTRQMRRLTRKPLKKTGLCRQ